MMGQSVVFIHMFAQGVDILARRQALAVPQLSVQFSAKKMFKFTGFGQ